MKTRFRHTEDILSRSRYFAFPSDETNLSSLIGDWRIEDILDDDAKSVITNASSVESASATHHSPEHDDLTARQRVEKQRILAVHLLNYSFSQEAHSSTSQFNRKTAETFLNVAESEDPDVITNCAMAIANVCSKREVRQFMYDLNALHKFTSLLPQITSADGNLSCALFYYYMSCDGEVEDRIWNAGFKAFQRTLTSDDFNLRHITLQSLSNLIPSSERLRVVELMASSIHQMYKDFGNKAWNNGIFTILLNMTIFPNTHHTLVDGDVLDIISLASGELDRTDVTAGRLLAQVLNNFLLSPDLAEELVHADYARIFIDLLHIDDSDIMETCMHSFLIMSTISGFVNSICDSDIVRIVGSLVCGGGEISNRVAEDAAGYLSNICRPAVKNSEQRVRDGAAIALQTLLKNYPQNLTIQKFCIYGIRDLLSLSKNCVTLFNDVMPILLHMAYDQRNNIEVIQCIHNICCAEECAPWLGEQEVELKILELLCTNVGKFPIKCALLRVLLIMSENANVITKILNRGLIKALQDLVGTAASDNSVWLDISRLLLVVIYQQPTLSEAQTSALVQLLQVIGGKNSSELVITNCSFILAFLSYSIGDFSKVDPIIRSILSINASDAVMNAASTVLYNVACSEKDSSMLLQDGMLHINIMIRMMRNGSARVQQNVAEAMRLLCIMPRCNELLLHHDLLSDFIVIALLRTNSGEVKRVCSEAFYNMLCHPNTRQKLLKGDLWWAMMRLSKADVSSVRLICARAVFNLASESGNIPALRENYAFVFIKEIVYESATAEFVDIFLQVIYNIICHADKTVPLNQTEIVSVIQIFVRSIPAVTEIAAFRWLAYLLWRIAKISVSNAGSEVIEFLNLDILKNLLDSKQLWARDMECRYHISRFTQVIISNVACCTSTPFNDILPLLAVMSSGLQNNTVDYDLPIVENVCGTILFYVSRNLVDANTVCRIPFLKDYITILLSPAAAPTPGSAPAASDTEVTNVMVIFFKLFAFCVTSIVNIAFQQSQFYVHDEIVSLVIAALPSRAFLQKKFFVDARTRVNAVNIVSTLSLSPTLGRDLLFGDLVSFLGSLMRDDKLNKVSLLVEFCSCVLRNISRNGALTQILTSCKGLGSLIKKLVSLSADVAGDVYKQRYAISVADILTNAAVTLYYIAHESLDQTELTAGDVLDVVTEVSQMAKEPQLSHVLKLVIGLVLDKSQGRLSFDPSFVQTILSELDDKERLTSQDLAKFMQLRSLSTAPDINPMQIDLSEFAGIKTPRLGVNDLWNPIVVNHRKKMEYSTPTEGSIMEPNRTPITSDVLQHEAVSAFQTQPYSKIVVTYPFLTEPCTLQAHEDIVNAERERKKMMQRREEEEELLERSQAREKEKGASKKEAPRETRKLKSQTSQHEGDRDRGGDREVLPKITQSPHNTAHKKSGQSDRSALSFISRTGSLSADDSSLKSSSVASKT